MFNTYLKSSFKYKQGAYFSELPVVILSQLDMNNNFFLFKREL